MIQKYINFHYTVSLDLFGSEQSTNAANYFTAGLKGRWQEERRKDDHVLTEDSANIELVPRRRAHHRRGAGAAGAQPRPARREYISDCESGLKRWNRVLEQAGIDRRLSLPHVGVQP